MREEPRMSSLAESVRKQCPELNPDLIEMHFRRMPGSYLDGCSAPEIARHLRLLALLKADRPVEVEIHPQETQIYDVVVVGEDRTGVLAFCRYCCVLVPGLRIAARTLIASLGECNDPCPWRILNSAEIQGGRGR